MKRQPQATVTVLRLPHLAAGTIRIEVKCPSSLTGITQLPGAGCDLDTRLLVTFATYEHEERCGDCDTSQAHARGSQEAREHVERMKGSMQVQAVRDYAQGRRN